MPFDPPQLIPQFYYGPKPNRPELLVDQYRVFLMDPVTQTFVGIDAPRGPAGHLGRLVYAQRTLSNRSV